MPRATAPARSSTILSLVVVMMASAVAAFQAPSEIKENDERAFFAHEILNSTYEYLTILHARI